MLPFRISFSSAFNIILSFNTIEPRHPLLLLCQKTSPRDTFCEGEGVGGLLQGIIPSPIRETLNVRRPLLQEAISHDWTPSADNNPLGYLPFRGYLPQWDSSVVRYFPLREITTLGEQLISEPTAFTVSSVDEVRL